MAPQITVKKEYILVAPRTSEFWEIWECLARLLKMPEYPQKNVIWVFDDGPIQLAYEDLYRITDFLKENFPAEVSGDKKAAFVVPTGLGKAMAAEYINLAKDLPVEFKTFDDFDSAEKWIRLPGDLPDRSA